jgi:glycosyltransferase involved in cell wall biosynthesis
VNPYAYSQLNERNERKKRILFFRQGNFSHINENVVAWVREQFPDKELLEIDVLQDVIKSSGSVVYGSAAIAVLTYLGRLASGQGGFRDLYYRTPFLFHAIRRIIKQKYAELAPSCLFSIQTQSLYDASIDGLPHFLYTDHTHLANLKYPGAKHSQLSHPQWIKLESTIYHRVRSNLVMSSFIRDSLVRDYGCEDSRIAIVGAAPNMPPPDLLPGNKNYENRTILFVGIDWERKGGPILLEGFRKVLEKMPDARLIIAGCTPKVDLPPNVEVVGLVPRSEISRLLLSASVLAQPSLREPQGINAIEALAHGIPVVAANVGALPESVEDGKCGRIVPPCNPDALAAALIELLSNPALCRRYGQAGRESANARYCSRAVSQRLGDAIRAGLARVGSSRTEGIPGGAVCVAG